MNLQHCINQINGALEDLGMRRAYDIKWPKYNYRFYCMDRIIAGTIALELKPPVDVPCWDFMVERFDPGPFFWLLWGWNMNNQGEPERDLEDHVDTLLNLPTKLCTIEPEWTVRKQVAALRGAG